MERDEVADAFTTSADPFADPVVSGHTEREIITESTIAVGHNASLTLGKDSLIILDENIRDRPRKFCGLSLPLRSKPTRAVPFFNVLSASLTVDDDLVLRYATTESSKSPLYVQTLQYPLNSPRDLAEKWIAHLLNRAYGPAQRKKRIKVLINPYGGRGQAQKRYNVFVAPILQAAECVVDTETTTRQGHAIEIAENIDVNAYDVIACASGDGLPMECFNGLGRKPNATEALRKIAITQLPCGSGNAMSWNLNGTAECSMAALCIVKGVKSSMDLVSVTQGSTRTLSFLSQSIGIIAESDLGTDHLRWMGDFRFTVGFLVRLLGETVYPIDISVKTEIDDKVEIKRRYGREIAKLVTQDGAEEQIEADKEPHETTTQGLPPLKYGTVNDPLPVDLGWEPLKPYMNLGNLYCGNMCIMAADTPFFPAALPNDGLLDLVTIDGDISKWKSLSMFLEVEKGTFLDNTAVRYRKVEGLRVVPRYGWAGADKINGASGNGPTSLRAPSLTARLMQKLSRSAQTDGYFSVDGERLPFAPFQLEVHRGLGTVLSRHPGRYEWEAGPMGWESITR